VIRLAAVALSVVVVLGAPARARAAVPLTSCGKTEGLQCGQVAVPLDRTGAVPGTVSLHVEILSAGRTARGSMFLIAGGPGQGSARSFDLGTPDTAAFLQAIFPDYTLVAFDNRGTGDSGVLDCPILQAAITASAERAAGLARDCAAALGASRQFYATRDHAEDIEAVRQALGLGKLALYGVSYGTKLALAYALAHPDLVERLLLDSVVPVELPDPLERNVLRAMPNTLSAFCAGGRCRSATRNFSADVVALAAKLEAKPIRGKVPRGGGATKTVRMTGENLLELVIDTDINPGLAAELPAAVRAARGGYTRPLLRLFELDARSSTVSAKDLSFALNAATTCADGQFPWSPSTPIGDRRALIDAAVAGLPAGSLGPFGNWAARLGTAFYCELWPAPAGRTPLGSGPVPNVPVLALSGGLDMRTPTANAAAVVQQFPQGHVLVVPGVGHSVLTTDVSLCSQRAVRNWILSGAVRSSCPRAAAIVKTTGAFPRNRGRESPRVTLAVTAKAVREAEAAWLQAVTSGVKLNPAGLYGGRLIAASSSAAFRLVGYSIVPGVRVSGKLTRAGVGFPIVFKGRIRIFGPAAAAGTIRVTRNSLSGVLGGLRVSGRR
jgi:pimeloyl-ACP methyl ester carboxylesterase